MRDDKVEELTRLVHEANPETLAQLDDAAVNEIANLLRCYDVKVKYDVARMLRQIGPHAKAALPRIEEALSREEMRERATQGEFVVHIGGPWLSDELRYAKFSILGQ